MVNQDLVRYVKGALSRGLSLSQIKQNLLAKGWADVDINEAINFVNNPNKKIEESGSEKQENSGRFKFFLIFLGIVFLVSVIIFIIALSNSNTLSESDLEYGKNISIKENQKIDFSFNNEKHEIKADSFEDGGVNLIIQSEPQSFFISVGEEKSINLDGDGYYDLKIRLDSFLDKKADLYVIKIHSKVCVPEWDCSSWSGCIEGVKNRTCIDVNSCSIVEDKPEETQSCECVENWTCDDWSVCLEGTQTRNCIDSNFCGIELNKPSETKNCTSLNCSELNGTLCNSSEVCNGTELNSSDSGICCNESCVLNESSLCSQGYFYCETSEYCEGNLENESEQTRCCDQECTDLVDYLETPNLSITWDKDLLDFNQSVSSCEPGYNISQFSSLVNLPLPVGINVTSHAYFELVGISGQENCIIDSNRTYYYINYTPKMRNYFLQTGYTEEEIDEKILGLNEDDVFTGLSATCNYSIDYIHEKINNWSQGNYSGSYSSEDDYFSNFNCSGDENAAFLI